jgi:hypothetical protein
MVNQRSKLIELQKLSNQLKAVAELPAAYQDYINELKRRSTFQMKLASQVKRVNSTFQRTIDTENSKLNLSVPL